MAELVYCQPSKITANSITAWLKTCAFKINRKEVIHKHTYTKKPSRYHYLSLPPLRYQIIARKTLTILLITNSIITSQFHCMLSKTAICKLYMITCGHPKHTYYLLIVDKPHFCGGRNDTCKTILEMIQSCVWFNVWPCRVYGFSQDYHILKFYCIRNFCSIQPMLGRWDRHNPMNIQACHVYSSIVRAFEISRPENFNVACFMFVTI